MPIEQVKQKSTWVAAVRAPLIPTIFFTVLSAFGFGFLGMFRTVLPGTTELWNEVLLSAPLALLFTFVGTYALGFVLTVVFGVLLLSLLPREIPLFSWLNRTRAGRIFLIFAVIIILAVFGINVAGFPVLLTLLCLGEYTSKLPHNKEAEVKKQGIFI